MSGYRLDRGVGGGIVSLKTRLMRLGFIVLLIRKGILLTNVGLKPQKVGWDLQLRRNLFWYSSCQVEKGCRLTFVCI